MDISLEDVLGTVYNQGENTSHFSDGMNRHLLINCKPQHYIPDVVQKLKGITSRILMKENREILNKKLWGGHRVIL